MVYAALFCLEYDVKPADIEIELRIYQNDMVEVMLPDVLDLTRLMGIIVHYNRRIDELREEVHG
jgi:hypothetical protein